LIHFSLLTGSARVSPKSEVDPVTIKQLREAIAKKESILGWVVKIVPSPEGIHIFELHKNGSHISSGYLAVKQDASERLWNMIQNIPSPPGVIINKPTSTPWLAVMPYIAGLDDIMKDVVLRFERLQALGEVGDLEKCVAWTLIELMNQ
jgi:hypothetical protein